MLGEHPYHDVTLSFCFLVAVPFCCYSVWSQMSRFWQFQFNALITDSYCMYCQQHFSSMFSVIFLLLKISGTMSTYCFCWLSFRFLVAVTFWSYSMWYEISRFHLSIFFWWDHLFPSPFPILHVLAVSKQLHHVPHHQFGSSDSLPTTTWLSQDNSLWLDSAWVSSCSWHRAKNCSLTFARLQLASLQCSRSLVQTTACWVSSSQVGDR